MKRLEAGPMLHESSTRRDRWWLPTWRVVAVLLLLGLVVNLGVAVAIARWSAPPGFRGLDPLTLSRSYGVLSWHRGWDLPDAANWPGPAPASWMRSPGELVAQLRKQRNDLADMDDINQGHVASWAPGWSTRAVWVYTGGADTDYDYEVHRIGFPFGLLRFDWCHELNLSTQPAPGVRNRLGLWRDGIKIPVSGEQTFPAYSAWILPLYPQAFGLVVNTVFYGVCLWGLYLAWTWPRRRRAGRLRRGECMQCRYPVVPGREVCPECGTAERPADHRVANYAPVAPAQYALTSPNSEHAP